MFHRIHTKIRSGVNTFFSTFFIVLIHELHYWWAVDFVVTLAYGLCDLENRIRTPKGSS